MTLSHQQKIAAFVLALYWPGLFVLAHIPIPHVVQEADVSDKSLHFLAYLILTFLIWSTVSGDRKVNWHRAAPWLVLFVIVVYGILDEWLQGYVAGRSCDIRDFFTDLAGALAGLILYSFLTFWPAGLLAAATFIFGITNVLRVNLAELLPITNAMFHLFAYAILTVLWIQCTRLFLAVKAPKAKWLILALAGPAGFLIIVKLFSVIAGKDFALSDMIISFGAIAAVIIAFCLRALFRRTKDAKNEDFSP
jgi:VanZ family protein